MEAGDFINAAVALGTLALAAIAFLQLRRLARESELQADTLRGLLIAEILRVSGPYQIQLQEWTGGGHKTFPPATHFEGTSPLLQTLAIHLHRLSSAERHAVTEYFIWLAAVQPQNTDRFLPEERQYLENLVRACSDAVHALAARKATGDPIAKELRVRTGSATAPNTR